EKKQLSRVTFVGTDHIRGELKPDVKEGDVPPEVWKKVRGGKFQVDHPRGLNDGERLSKKLEEAGVPTNTAEDTSGWLGSFFMLLLPALLLVGFIVLFVLPRF